jgi:hypothetical protein
MGVAIPIRTTHTIGTWKGDNHMQWIQRSFGALLVAGTLSLGLAGPVAAQPQTAVQDGLVNVNLQIGEEFLTIEDVNIGLAAQIIAAICPNLRVGPLAVLGSAVDRGSGDQEVENCVGNVDEIIITQN